MDKLEIPVKIITIDSSERRLFAAMALQGILSNSTLSNDEPDIVNARIALKSADALIAELNRKDPRNGSIQIIQASEESAI